MKHSFETYIGLAIGFGYKERNGIKYVNIIFPFFYYELAIPQRGYKIKQQ